jgi:TQXA domain-containing protein
MATALWSDQALSDALRSSVARLDVARAAHPLPLTGLSRVRGGTYSATVGIVRFEDGTTAHTDLIRLNPNIDAYSLDFHGSSPRQLSHYREAHWAELPVAAGAHSDQLLAILSHSYPHVSPRRLTERVRAAGHPIRHGQLPVHTIISATQAAIWHVTNGLGLDVSRLDLPVRVVSRGADGHARPVTATGTLDWRTELPAGRTVHLELGLSEAQQLSAYEFEVGPHTGRHPISVRLEQSSDDTSWTVVSSSAFVVPDQHRTAPVRRTLGVGATVHGSEGAAGQTGYRHYRLAITGPADRDGYLELRDVRIHLASASRYRNDEDLVHVYDYLLSHALSLPTRGQAHPVHQLGHHVLSGALPRIPQRYARVRALVGSRTVGGPQEFTPLIVLTTETGSAGQLTDAGSGEIRRI